MCSRPLPNHSSLVYPDEAEQPSLEQLGRIMFEAIRLGRARMAVQNRLAASEEDYQPSHSEYMEMMSLAFAVVVNMEPDVSERAVNTPADELRDAVLRT